MRKINYEWLHMKTGAKTNLQPIRLIVGAAIAITLLGPIYSADAQNERIQELQKHLQQINAQQQQQQQQQQHHPPQQRINNNAVLRNIQSRQRAEQNRAAVQENTRRQNEQANKNARSARQSERERKLAIERENRRVAEQNRVNQQNHTQRALNQNANRMGFRPDKRWDYKLSTRDRYQTYKKYHNNWNEQRTYLRSNLSRFNELANLNRQQQDLLDSQMRAAYLQYRNNQYNGAYNWNTYSDPQFIDYMQTRNPSLLQNILGFLGLGDNGGYLYSPNWSDERSELTQNIANIHQLSLEGRITAQQESALLDQLRPEFMEYKNNRWNGAIGWSQYSDPNFIDYLNRKKPSILTTVRDFLVR